jgi:hypothetical protein
MGVERTFQVAAAGDDTANSRDLATLLTANGARITNLLQSVHKDILKPLYDAASPHPHQYDDIWALRFVLSHADDTEAVTAAAANIVWRKEKAAMLDAAGKGEKHPPFAAIERFVAADYHGSTLEGAPLYLIRAGISNPSVGAIICHSHSRGCQPLVSVAMRPTSDGTPGCHSRLVRCTHQFEIAKSVFGKK